MSDVPRLPNLRMVLLKSPFQIWSRHENETFKDLFSDLIGLKIRGYGAEYPEGVLPVDTSDFIATHLLICRDERGHLTPITGFKTTLLQDCEKHRVSFPGLGLVQAAEASPHIEVMKDIMARCLREKKQLAYTGSWTIEPALRKQKELSRHLVQLFKAIYVFHHLEERVDEVITGGTMRFKADVLLGALGHDPLELNGQILPPIQVKHLFQENVRVLHLKKFAPQACAAAEPFRDLWENRIEISAESVGLLERRQRTG